KREDLATLERRYSTRVQIIVSDKLMPHQSEIETRTREVVAPIAVIRPGEVVSADRSPSAAMRSGARRPAAAAVPYARGPAPAAREQREPEDGDAAKGRRRRGGRGRRGEGAEGTRVASDTVAATDVAPGG